MMAASELKLHEIFWSEGHLMQVVKITADGTWNKVVCCPDLEMPAQV